MKITYLIVLIFWMIFTLILIFSLIGMIFLAPVPNYTGYYRPMTDDRRSTWMLIGMKTLNKLLED